MARLPIGPRISLLLVLLLLPTTVGAQALVQEWVRIYDSGQADQAVDLDIAPNGTVYVLDSHPRHYCDTTRVLAYSADGTQLWASELDCFWANDVATTASSGAVVAGARDSDNTNAAIFSLAADGDTLWSWTQEWGHWNEAMAVTIDVN